METGSDEVMTESYMTMAQSENCRLVDASIQKNISFDGKPMTPTSWTGGIGEIFSLRDQLKQAEEKASQVQREVQCPALLESGTDLVHVILLIFLASVSSSVRV